MRPLIRLHGNLLQSGVFLNDSWLTLTKRRSMHAGIGRPAHCPFDNRPKLYVHCMRPRWPNRPGSSSNLDRPRLRLGFVELKPESEEFLQATLD